MSANWVPADEYVKTIAQSTSYAGFYFTDTAGRPVQLRSAHSAETWQWPGGNMDLGETPWECALRECVEETGIVFDGPQNLLAVHFIVQGAHWPLNKFGVIFDGGQLTGAQIKAIVLDPAEHTELRVHTMEEWKEIMSPVSFTRLKAADAARRTGTVAYLER
ncbi:NUDIX domain-containing protein [Streptomyces venezuelae]|uniref:NUDIX domain-containing protein n=1 Tax=Streptomyces venezuelae TaxID=54571 RepID=A0A5P2DSU6_STRVZ|nr:NUDIX hydrolase [Streptomyces venezuelae]QES57208.1 NUDIX domain-containing protein [Streptomyces venezuelae]